MEIYDRSKGNPLTQKFAPKHWDRVEATVERGVEEEERIELTILSGTPGGTDSPGVGVS